MAKIIWSPKASKNLAAVHSFIAQDSELHAFRVAEEITSEVRSLIQQPGKGKIVPEFSEPSIREIKLYSYRVIYQVTPAGDILIAKVWHESRMLKNL